MHTASSYSDQKEFFQPSSTGQEGSHPGSTGQDLIMAQPSTSGFSDLALTGAYTYPPEPDTLDIDPPQSDTSYTDDQASSDEGEISSNTLEKPEQTEDINYRETVRSIRSFIWDGTTSPPLRVILVSLIKTTILGRARLQNALLASL